MLYFDRYAGSIPASLHLTNTTAWTANTQYLVQNCQYLINLKTEPIMWENLTPRQMEIIHLTQWGASQKMIANALDISVLTVNKTITQAYARMGVDPTELRERYNIEVLGVDPSLCPLQRYDFTPRTTRRLKINAVMLLLLTLAQLSNSSTDFIRTVARVKLGRAARARQEQLAEYAREIEILL